MLRSNPIKIMRAEKLIQFLLKAIPAKRRVLIKGRPGMGKTDIAYHVCNAVGADMVLMHPAISDPTDFMGMPAITNGGAEAHFLPFGNLAKLVKATRPTVCFLDDVGQAAPAVQAALMQLVLARSVNGTRISDEVTFLGATNDTTHCAGVSGMIEPLKSRWDCIVELSFSSDDWASWALDNAMPIELIAYGRQFPDSISPSDWKPSKEIKPTPCPRTWASVGEWLNAGVDDHEVLAGAVGDVEAIKFSAFRQMMHHLPSLDDILLNPSQAPLPPQTITVQDISGKEHTYSGACLGVALASALAARATAQNLGRVMIYSSRLEKRLDVLIMKDAVRRNKSLSMSREFVRWSVENQGVL